MKRKSKFKLIPFLISLFIVIGATTGIVLYSYYNWQENKVNFLKDYFHEEDHEKVSTDNLIENAIKWTNGYYQQNPGTITYRTPKGTTIGSTASSSTNNMYVDENGVLRTTNFSLSLYGVANKSDDEWSLQYQFYLSDLYYKTKSWTPNNLYFVFVKGISAATDMTVDEKTGKTLSKTQIKNNLTEHPTQTLTGDDALNYLYAAIQTTDGDLGAGGGTQTTTYKYSYQNTQTSSTTNYYIYDNGAKDAEGAFDDHYVYRFAPKNNSTNEYNFLDCTEGLTFAIYYEDSTGTEDGSETTITKLVEGTFKDIQEADDFVTDNKLGYTGFEENFNKAHMAKYVWKRLLLHGSIAFVISGILAVLFYLIWQDDDDTEKNTQKKKPQKAK